MFLLQDLGFLVLSQFTFKTYVFEFGHNLSILIKLKIKFLSLFTIWVSSSVTIWDFVYYLILCFCVLLNLSWQNLSFEFCHILSFEKLKKFEGCNFFNFEVFNVLSWQNLIYWDFCQNLRFKDFFLHNLSFWVMSLFELLVLSQFEFFFSFVTILVFDFCYTYSIWVLPKLEFLIFVTIFFLKFYHSFCFEFGHNIRVKVLLQLKLFAFVKIWIDKFLSQNNIKKKNHPYKFQNFFLS